MEKIDGNLQFLNFGTPGSGTDQAFLRWRRDGRHFKSDVVLLGIGLTTSKEIWPSWTTTELKQAFRSPSRAS
jgi:hypothetical protein